MCQHAGDFTDGLSQLADNPIESSRRIGQWVSRNG
jgi:hypothetical protein